MSDQQRVAVLQEAEHMTVETRPVPTPGPGEVQVAVRAVSVCGSDVHYYDHGRIGGFVMHAPLVLGHETSGVVSAVGEGVEEPAVGTRVAVEPQRNCGRCEQCVRGRYHLCPHIAFFATPPVDGSFAQYVVVPAGRAHPVPDALSDDAAAMIEPLAVAVHAAGKADIGPGTRVLVTGGGPGGSAVPAGGAGPRRRARDGVRPGGAAPGGRARLRRRRRARPGRPDRGGRAAGRRRARVQRGAAGRGPRGRRDGPGGDRRARRHGRAGHAAPRRRPVPRARAQGRVPVRPRLPGGDRARRVRAPCVSTTW